MKKIKKFASFPRCKTQSIRQDNDSDFVRAWKKTEELIFHIYAIYTGVLDYQFEEGKISATHKTLKKKQYDKERHLRLSVKFRSVDDFLAFYQSCRRDLQEAIDYAKLQTGPDLPKALSKDCPPQKLKN